VVDATERRLECCFTFSDGLEWEHESGRNLKISPAPVSTARNARRLMPVPDVFSSSCRIATLRLIFCTKCASSVGQRSHRGDKLMARAAAHVAPAGGGAARVMP